MTPTMRHAEVFSRNETKRVLVATEEEDEEAFVEHLRVVHHQPVLCPKFQTALQLTWITARDFDSNLCLIC